MGIGFGACCVRAWRTCVSRGRLRGSGVFGACRGRVAGRVGGAVPWGLASGRVACTDDIMWRDMRFAWQAWDSGCMSALGKALEGGSAWQVWGNVHLDVGARAFHVAGVGQGSHRRCREGGFAWPA